MRARLAFAASPLGAVRGMTARAAADWGAAFATDTTNDAAGGPDAHVLRVRSCLYHTVCAAEGVPSLTRVFCALDAALFAPVSDAGRGLTFALDETLAEGAEACVFRFGSARDAKGGLGGWYVGGVGMWMDGLCLRIPGASQSGETSAAAPYDATGTERPPSLLTTA
ncbi:hypothetical protein MMPV_008478 [Pyropia vietnamensis]